jgi:hypothetical protein
VAIIVAAFGGLDSNSSTVTTVQDTSPGPNAPTPPR